MHLDWTVNVGQILIMAIILPLMYSFFRFQVTVRDFIMWVKELLRNFPPHLHVGDEIVYPKDLTPGGTRNY